MQQEYANRCTCGFSRLSFQPVVLFTTANMSNTQSLSGPASDPTFMLFRLQLYTSGTAPKYPIGFTQSHEPIKARNHVIQPPAPGNTSSCRTLRALKPTVHPLLKMSRQIPSGLVYPHRSHPDNNVEPRPTADNIRPWSRMR